MQLFQRRQRRPQAVVYSNLEGFMDQDRFERAIALRNANCTLAALQEFSAMQEESTDANDRAALILNEARCYADIGRVVDAERTLARARDLAPDDVEARFNVDFLAACVAAQGGDYEQAVCQFQTLLEDYIGILQTQEYRDFYEDIQQRKAVCLIHLHRYGEALRILKEASSSFITLKTEDEQEVHLNLGTCYAGLHEDRLAKAEFLRAIEFGLRNSVEARARYNLGVASFLDGGFAQAKNQLEWILQTYRGEIPNVPRKDVYHQLSRTYHYLGEKDNAERYRRLAEGP
jgi:tetratricopeptide (TPR) repeat protein